MLRKQMNVAALYTAASNRLPWTKAQLRPYVVHNFTDEQKPSSWLFDIFLLLDFKVFDGTRNYAVETSFLSQSPVAKKSHWKLLMDSYFDTEGVTPENSVLSRLDEFVSRRRTQLSSYNRADVNEDGVVDIVDLNIVSNEMLGHNTGYGDRADVNNDGSVDISDYNAVQDVLIGGLSNI